ncbi:MAG: hypothetical protein KAT70_07430 [Thermoplasmata archaeon]|nr:hypothetical protein [Thermoplasmata archaeon]
MAMNRERFRLAAEALGKKNGMELLYELHEQGKGTASSLAKATGLHTATAMKYLGALAAAGLLETRTVRGKTREMIEYRLPGPRISLVLDLSDEGNADLHLSEALIEAMLEKANRIYGEPLDPPPTGNPYDLFLVLEERYGRDEAEDMAFGSAHGLERTGEDMEELIRLLPVLATREVEG